MSVNKKKIRREISLNGTRIWVTADTEQEYAVKIGNLYAEKGFVQRTANHRFKDYADKWFEVFSKPNVEPVTARSYRQQLVHHIYPVLGDMFIEDIVPQNIQTIFNNMGENAKQETKNKTKNVLNQIFKMAEEDRLIAYNPMRSSTLRIKGACSTVTEPYSVSDMRYFIAHLKELRNEEDRAWMAISVCLPLRPEEVLGLRWIDIDEEQLVIHVRSTVTHPNRNLGVFKEYTKTEASRRDLSIPRKLLDYLPERGNPLDFVVGGFCPASYTKVRRMRERIAQQIGYDGTITPRRFRTTVATDISATTHDLKLVQHMLGHATPQMTLKHYDKGRSTAIDATSAIESCYGL